MKGVGILKIFVLFTISTMHLYIERQRKKMYFVLVHTHISMFYIICTVYSGTTTPYSLRLVLGFIKPPLPYLCEKMVSLRVHMTGSLQHGTYKVHGLCTKNSTLYVYESLGGRKRDFLAVLRIRIHMDPNHFSKWT